MNSGRQLVWFYLRPTLHQTLLERAAHRGRDLELEIVEILESATRPTPRTVRGRQHLRLVPADEAGLDAS